MDIQSPSGVPWTQSWTWSMAALAADAADDAPRASMIAAPRLATRRDELVRVPRPGRRARSPACRFDLRVEEVRVLRRGVVAPDRHVRDVGDRHVPVFWASCAIARLWSRRVIAWKRVGGHVRRVGLGDQRVGVRRVADHEDAHVVGRARVDRLALRAEDAAVRLEQVGALHARRARAGTDEQADVRAVERRRWGRRGCRCPPAAGTRSRRAPSRCPPRP